MRKQLFRSIILGGLSAIGIMVGNQEPAFAADDVTIEIVKNDAGDFVFSKPDVIINAGDSITWVAITPKVPHHLVSDTGTELTKEFKNPTKPSHTFTSKAEKFKYHCEIHPDTMIGTITVK